MLPALAPLAATAADQDGLFTRRQALAAGVSEATLRALVRRGALVQPQRAVYADRELLVTPQVAARAAVLSAPGNAVVSGFTAARLHGLAVLGPTRRDQSRPPDEVTVWPGSHRDRPSLRLRCRLLPAVDVADVGGLRVTSVTRTLLDHLVGNDRLRAVFACEAAVRAGLVDPADLDRLLARIAGRSFAEQARQWRALVDARSESPLETGTRLALADGGLPAPIPQFPLYDELGRVSRRLDLGYPEQLLGIECDGRSEHGPETAILSDRWRQFEVVAQRWSLMRVTWGDAIFRPQALAMVVGRALAARAA